MPVEFGTQSREIPGIGVLLSGTEEALLRRHRDQQRRRMGPPRDRGTLRESARLQVYIYNAGPFTRTMDTLGSVGVVIVPGLPEAKTLQGLSVAGPVIRPGLSGEPYPSEPAGRYITPELPDHLTWADADGEVFVLAERSGIDEALRIIGGHAESRRLAYSSSPYEQGCFVSTILEQKEPVGPKEPGEKASRLAIREFEKLMGQYEDDLRLWIKWEASVKAAQRRFIDWAARRGEEQCLAFSNGTYVRDEELYVLARVLNKTDRDWNFLSGTAENVAKKKCWSCRRTIEMDAPKCQCGELQISQQEYDARRAKVMAGE